MIYVTSRVSSGNQFDFYTDPPIWNELVSNMEQIDTSIWKVRTLGDIFTPSPAPVPQIYASFPGRLLPEVVAESVASYLQIEQGAGQSTFTIASPSQSALEHLQALIANLYEPVSPGRLDNFLRLNREVPVKIVEVFNRKTGDTEQKVYARPISCEKVLDLYPPPLWKVLNLVVLPDIHEPTRVSRLQIKARDNQAWFLLDDQEQFSSLAEDVQARHLFTLADKAFDGLAAPVYA